MKQIIIVLKSGKEHIYKPVIRISFYDNALAIIHLNDSMEPLGTTYQFDLIRGFAVV